MKCFECLKKHLTSNYDDFVIDFLSLFDFKHRFSFFKINEDIVIIIRWIKGTKKTTTKLKKTLMKTNFPRDKPSSSTGMQTDLHVRCVIDFSLDAIPDATLLLLLAAGGRSKVPN